MNAGAFGPIHSHHGTEINCVGENVNVSVLTTDFHLCTKY